MAGRPRKPSALKRAQGTYRKDQEPNNEPGSLDFCRMPDCPRDLNRYGKKFWRENVRKMVKMKVLTKSDLSLMHQAAQCFGTMSEAFYSIYHAGKKKRTLSEYMGDRAYSRKKMPELITYEHCQTQMLLYYREMGMTPCARNKISLPEAPKNISEMERLINGG